MLEEKQTFNSPDEILRAAVARAKRVPEGFDMGTWMKDAETPCGTAGCLAYEICAVAGDLGVGESSIAQQAMEILGLEGAPALFYLETWPKPFREKYEGATNPDERVEALNDVVEAWINGTLFEGVTHVDGNLRLTGYGHQLPNSLQSVGGYLYLRGYGHQLPNSLQSVGGYLDLRGYGHPLPDGIVVKGKTIR